MISISFSTLSLCDHCDHCVDLSAISRDLCSIASSPTEGFVPSTAGPPPEEQIKLVRNLLERLEDLTRTLDQEINSLETRLEDVRKTRQQVSDVSLLQRSILAPIRRLPPEILPTIFREYSPVSMLTYRDVTELWRERTTLMLVCRLWNHIVLFTPQLWNVLILIVDRKIRHPASLPRLLYTWLRRTGHMPLTVVLDLSFYQLCGNEALCDVMFPFHKRSKTMTITPYVFHTKSSLQKFLQGDFQLLEKLIMVPGKAQSRPAHHKKLLPLTPNFPRLKALEMHQDIYTGFPFPAHQITTMCLHDVYATWVEIADLLRSTANLSKLDISHFMLEGVVTERESGEINLPCLKWLTVQLDCLYVGEPCDRLFRSLVAPALLHLNIHCDSISPDVVDNVTDMVRRSRCSLKSLSLLKSDYCPLDLDENILRAIQATPTITTLVVNILSVQMLLSAFRLGVEDRVTAIPQLKTLKIRIQREPQVPHLQGLLNAI